MSINSKNKQKIPYCDRDDIERDHLQKEEKKKRKKKDGWNLVVGCRKGKEGDQKMERKREEERQQKRKKKRIHAMRGGH